MSKANHTQGGWHLDKEGNVCIADGRIVVKGERIHSHAVRNPAFENPKRLLEIDDGGEANARLIAAAPKLLEALESVLGKLPVAELLKEDGKQAITQALSAIAQAKGE